MKWSHEYSVNVNDLDVNNILSASGIMRFMQDAANREMEAHSPSYMELFDKGYAFIICRLRMSSYAPLYVHDKIEVQTWTIASRSLQFDRCFRVYRNGIIVAEAVTAWALYGIEDKKLHRASEFDFGYVVDEMLELDLPPRLKIPDETEMKLKGERTVEYADIDVNGHMNNTHYPDILCGFLEGGMKGQRVISLALSFVNEAHLGDDIKYYCGVSDDIHYVRSIRSDGKINAEAEIILETI